MPRRKTPAKNVDLNSEQYAAVSAGDGAWAVVAGPGSGKTTVLVARYNRLREVVDPEDILSLTFTKAAATNMQKRAGNPDAEKSFARFSKPNGFMTFHSFALGVITREYEEFGWLHPSVLSTPGQTAKVLAEVARRHGSDYRTLSSYISSQKRQYIRAAKAVENSEETGENEKLALAYKEYEARMRAVGVMDFDSLLLESVELLTGRPDIRTRYQYRFVQCDEAQDTDPLQLRLVQLVSEQHKNVFFVGDTNQNIYSWRGSSSDLLVNFQSYFPDGKVLYLNTNYRATKKLTEFNYQIAPFQPPDPYVSPNDDGIAPVVECYPSEVLEAKTISGHILSKYDHDNPRLFEDAAPPKKIPDISAAILARTNRALRPHEEALGEAGVRYHLIGKSGFFSQAEVRNVLAYTQLASAPTDTSIQIAIRAPFHPSRFIRKKELIEKLVAKQKQQAGYDRNLASSLWMLLSTYHQWGEAGEQQNNSVAGLKSFIASLSKYRQSTAEKAVTGIITDLRAIDYYRDEEEAFDNDPVQNLTELLRIASRFGSIPELLEYVRKIQAASRAKKGVAVGTIHAAKGQEWDSVFLVNCQEGILPHVKGDPEEEERIFFVGCSRAAKFLNLSYSGPPSRFLPEVIEESEDWI